MVDIDVIEQWRSAPRLTSFAAFFDRTASGTGGAPDRGDPLVDLSLLDFDLDCAVFADTHRKLWGPFDKHYFASIPYRIEEECRLGSLIVAYSLRAWARSRAQAKIYTLGTGTGCLSRTIASLGGGRIETLCCSPTAANREAFNANRGSDHAHFFLGPFFDLNEERLADDPGLKQFCGGFDVLFEDTTFQMYHRDRTRQLEFVVPKIKPGGLLIQVQKLAHEDVEIYRMRERQKDELFKPRYFSPSGITDKKDEVLDTMERLQVDLATTTTALRAFFRYSVITWNSGNFYTFVSSNARETIREFIALMVKPAIPPAFCHHLLPIVLVDTDSDPIAPALAWRPPNQLGTFEPRRSLVA